MAEEKIFVGRTDELKQFGEVLKDPKGQAVLVVGQAGMGKTWLVNKFAEIAGKHPELKCGYVRYEVTPTDSVDSTIALMMDNAFDAAQVEEGSFDGTARRLEQWRAFLNVFNLGDLILSLRRDPAKNTREQSLERLRRISNKMPKNGRAVFIVDPEKYMQEKSDQSWAIVVKSLPEKIKFIFAQRPEDVLVDSETFDGLDNVVRIPEKQRLDVLSEEDVDELIDLRSGDLRYTVTEVRKVLSRYKGHPYAIGAALDLIEAGTRLEELPKRAEPIKFAEKQWEKVKEIKHGAIELFEVCAILEVGVPDEVIEAVSDLKPAERKGILGEKYLKGLLREEGEGRRIYHAILADYILEQVGEAEKKEYHERAVGVYREKLEKAKKEQTRPDGLAAERLAEHVLAAEGKDAFLDAFVNECYTALFNLGLLDAAMNLSERALGMVKKNSEDEAIVRGNLGLIYRVRGELEKAEEMHRRALKIDEKLGNLEGIASDYGNLGLIYYVRGELEKAEGMFREGLKIDEKLGRLEGIASQYGNLGLIYMDKGELKKAEEMHKKSLEIEKKLGRLEGIASDYGNLGNIYYKRDKLDKAEEMHRKALKIGEKLGSLEEIAKDYSNLGVIYGERGDIKKARGYWEKAVGLYKRIGMPHMVEKVEGWIEGL